MPGTDCSSVALIDTQGLTMGEPLGVRRLFSLSLLISSTFGLNVMRRFNDDTLHRLSGAASHATASLRTSPLGDHPPNLLVFVRDVRHRMAQVHL